MLFLSGWLGRVFAGNSLLLVTARTIPSRPEDAMRPEIIITYADNLGYGDVSANEKETIQTPNID